MRKALFVATGGLSGLVFKDDSKKERTAKAAAKVKILGMSLTPDGPGRDPATFAAVEANVAAARHLADLAVDDHGSSAATVSGD
jgi:hypothetical protein